MAAAMDAYWVDCSGDATASTWAETKASQWAALSDLKKALMSVAAKVGSLVVKMVVRSAAMKVFALAWNLADLSVDLLAAGWAGAWVAGWAGAKAARLECLRVVD